MTRLTRALTTALLAGALTVFGCSSEPEADGTGGSGGITGGAVFEQAAYVKASNTDANDVFYEVAIDGKTLVVGAPDEGSAARGVNGDDTNNDAEESGAAYIFERDADGWTQTAYLKSSNAFSGDHFGESVAVSDDVVVIGARWESTNGPVGGPLDPDSLGSGAAYVFERSGGTWVETAYLKASDARKEQGFGFSVSIDGDTITVGAAFEPSIYVFERAGGTWVETEKVPVGLATSVVHAYSEGTLAVESGESVDVFEKVDGEWTRVTTLTSANPTTRPYFGESIAIAGGIIAVGAPGDDSASTGVDGDPNDDGATDSGAVYIFEKRVGEWTQAAYLKASNTGSLGFELLGDAFGIDVAVVGGRVVVGASGEASAATGVDGDQASDDAPGSGAAYVFDRIGDQWTQTNYLKASNTEEGDLFGLSVAVSGDTVAVGAPIESSASKGVNSDQANNDAPQSGAVYIFHGVGD